MKDIDKPSHKIHAFLKNRFKIGETMEQKKESYFLKKNTAIQEEERRLRKEAKEIRRAVIVRKRKEERVRRELSKLTKKEQELLWEILNKDN